jgi:hypothetical protein
MSYYRALTEFKQEYLDIMAAVEEDEGFIPEEALERLQTIESDVSSSLETYYNLISEIEGVNERFKKEIARLTSQIKRKEVFVELLKDRSMALVKAFGKAKENKTGKSWSFTTVEMGIKFNVSPSLYVKEDELDMTFKPEEIDPFVDSTVTFKLTSLKAVEEFKQKLATAEIPVHDDNIKQAFSKSRFKAAIDEGQTFKELGSTVDRNYRISFK